MRILHASAVMTPGDDPHRPPARDLWVEGALIREVALPGSLSLAAQADPDVLDAAGKLVIPGLVNAHHHSSDLLAKGLVEDTPFDAWALQVQPGSFGARSATEIRVRTLLAALESLKSGVTTVQDFCTLVPMDEPTLDRILAAYAESGIRCAFSIALRDEPSLDIAPFVAADVPADVRAVVQGQALPAAEQLAFVEAQIARVHPLPERLSWILSPAGPQRCSTGMLAAIGELSLRHRIPVTTHVYETRAQTAKARLAGSGRRGSLVARMLDAGLFAHRAALAHLVWPTQEELAVLAEAGAVAIHNPLSNLKLKNGIAPVRAWREAGLRLALGCDNATCSDALNIFQAMKMHCLLGSGIHPEPGGPLAADALEAATRGGAWALGLEESVGAIVPGMAADLCLIDLDNIAYQPLNSVVRQLVYSDSGAGVDTVIVAGRVVLRGGKSTLVDEAALREELRALMPGWRRDFDDLQARHQQALPVLLAAQRRVDAIDIGVPRWTCRCGGQG